MSKLLSSNNKELLTGVKQYWVGMLLHLTSLLTIQVVDDPINLELRAGTLARLAGLGLAMHQYFGGAVERLGYADNRGVQELGLRTYETATKHMRQLEERMDKSLS